MRLLTGTRSATAAIDQAGDDFHDMTDAVRNAADSAAFACEVIAVAAVLALAVFVLRETGAFGS